MKIFLVGMPGSGKSTLGVKLAQNLSLPFVDLDKEIENKAGKSIPEIFRTDGEDTFRRLEASELAEWCANPDSFVLATGGGAPCFYNGMDNMNQNGLTVFLNVTIHELVRRLQNKKDRPLLHNESAEELQQRLETIAKIRDSIYRQASITIDNPSSAEDIIKHINLRR
jgi:shikimate kinase